MKALLVILFAQLLGSDDFQTREFAESICPVFIAVELENAPDIEIRQRAKHVLERNGLMTTAEKREAIGFAALHTFPLWMDGLPLDYGKSKKERSDLVWSYQLNIHNRGVDNADPGYLRDHIAAVEFFMDLSEKQPIEEVLLLMRRTCWRCRCCWRDGNWIDLKTPDSPLWDE